MTSSTTLSSDHKTASGVKISAIVMILLGVIALFLPAAAGIGITIFFGAVVLMAGFAYGILAFTAHGTSSFFLRLLVGIAFTLAGIYLLANPSMGLVTLTYVVAIIFLIEGIAEMASFFTLRALPGAGFLLLNAIFSLVLAYLIWRSWPVSSLWAIGTLVGVNLISSGLTRLAFVPPSGAASVV